MPPQTLDAILSDAPAITRDDDRLNRAPFADRIANTLCNLPHGRSLVIGIHGPWGDGKTSVLNLTRTALQDNTSIVVRDFNPWRLTDEDAILRGFFEMLAGAMEASLNTRLERLRSRGGTLARIARCLTTIAALFSKSAETLDDLLTRIGDIAHTGDMVSLETLRDRITNVLKEAPKRIVVLIDDIDRLDKDETYILFRLIKACADFPNVSYVLAFDDNVVADALSGLYGGSAPTSGRAFLEKIIQLPLSLPNAARADLRRLCFEHVDRVISASGIELSQQQIGEFAMRFERGAAIRLNTPRAAKRYANALMFAFPMLKNEVNVVDLLLIEAVRVFFPDIYEVICAHHEECSGVASESSYREDESKAVACKLNSKLAHMDSEHAQAIRSLITHLYPRLSAAFGGSHYGPDWLARWDDERRICSPQYGPRYFSYSLHPSDVGDAEFNNLIQLVKSRDLPTLNEALSAYFEGPKCRRMIDKLRTAESELDSTCAMTLAVAIAECAAKLPNPPSSISFAEPPGQAAILVSRLLQSIKDDNDRLTTALKIIDQSMPLWFGAECTRWFRTSNRPEENEDNALSENEEREALKALARRIKARAAENCPLFDPDVPQETNMLYDWAHVEGRGPVQKHLLAMFEDNPELILTFLLAHAPRSWGSDSALPNVGQIEARQLKRMKKIIDLDVLADSIIQNCDGNFENPQWFPDYNTPINQRLPEQFMAIYKKWKIDGEPQDE